MKPIIIHSQAWSDLDEAMAWYTAHGPGLALDLLAEFEQAVASIKQNPGLGTPHRRTGFRRLAMRRFPYRVIYAELDDVIWVVAVAHAKRRPDYWRRRRIG